MIYLVIGGARSGKSTYAERLLCPFNKQMVYVATATGGDDEMVARITYHKKQRLSCWKLIEEPLQLSKIVQQLITENQSDTPLVILIECMTLWLTNWFCLDEKNRFKKWQHEKELFFEQLSRISARQEIEIIIVSNEVGSGIIPMGNLSRDFVDQAGWLNQSLAAIADNVTLVVAGLPVKLK